jgi:hypothetical protein
MSKTIYAISLKPISEEFQGLGEEVMKGRIL